MKSFVIFYFHLYSLFQLSVHQCIYKLQKGFGIFSFLLFSLFQLSVYQIFFSKFKVLRYLWMLSSLFICLKIVCLFICRIGYKRISQMLFKIEYLIYDHLFYKISVLCFFRFLFFMSFFFSLFLWSLIIFSIIHFVHSSLCVSLSIFFFDIFIRFQKASLLVIL